jgi:hypothetical protein
LHVPDEPQITHRYPKRSGDHRQFGYPLLPISNPAADSCRDLRRHDEKVTS